MKRRSFCMALSVLCVLGAVPAAAGEPLSRPFSKRMVKGLVDTLYEAVRAGDTMPMGESARARYAEIDTDKNGSISRSELGDAILNARFRLSLKGAGAENKLALKLVNFIDGEDGIVGGQIRVNAGMMSSEEAVKNLESGAWTVGAGFFPKGDDAPVVGIRQDARGAELTLP